MTITAEAGLEAPDLSFRRPWAAAIDRAIGAVVEPLAALLVLAEILILAAGVVSRYVIRQPLVWSDELATILLLWLAMLGAVVAYRRGEHIRLSVVLRRCSEGRRAVLETIGSVVHPRSSCSNCCPPALRFSIKNKPIPRRR